MRQLTAFLKKEWMEAVRTGRLYLSLLVFFLFGIMNPALAKLTPWLYETLSKSMEEQGIVLKDITVDALTSWQQYYKNISLMLIVAVILFSGVLVNEYQKGTLVNILTKGMARWKVLAGKGIMTLAVWSGCHWLAYGVTFGYNSHFWDNGQVSHPFFASLCIYVLGIWLISLIFLGSVVFKSASPVLLFTGAAFAVCYLLELIPGAAPYLPTRLLQADRMLTGAAPMGEYLKAFGIVGLSAAVFWCVTIVVFNKKKI